MPYVRLLDAMAGPRQNQVAIRLSSLADSSTNTDTVHSSVT